MPSSSSLTTAPIKSSEYVLLMNRFKLLNLVQRIAHRDVLAMIETIGLDGLHYKCTSTQPWMRDWNMFDSKENNDDDNDQNNASNSENLKFKDKWKTTSFSTMKKAKLERNKHASSMQNKSLQQATSIMSEPLTNKEKIMHKVQNTDKKNNNSVLQSEKRRYNNRQTFSNRNNVNKQASLLRHYSSSSPPPPLPITTSPRLTQDEIDELVHRLAQPRELYTIDLDESSLTSENEETRNHNSTLTNLNTPKYNNRNREIAPSMPKMMPIKHPLPNSAQEPIWKQLQKATGIMESAPLPLHLEEEQEQEERQESYETVERVKKQMQRNTEGRDDSSTRVPQSLPRPRSQTKQYKYELSEHVTNNYKDFVGVAATIGGGSSNNDDIPHVPQEFNMTRENIEQSNKEEQEQQQLEEEEPTLYHTNEEREQEETEAKKQEEVEHDNNVQTHYTDAKSLKQIDSNANQCNMSRAPLTSIHAVAPKPKPAAVVNTKRVPLNIIQHAAALVARQRTQRQKELNKRQEQEQELQQQEERGLHVNNNVNNYNKINATTTTVNHNTEELAATQRYLPTNANAAVTSAAFNHCSNSTEGHNTETPRTARSYSIAKGHDANTLFAETSANVTIDDSHNGKMSQRIPESIHSNKNNNNNKSDKKENNEEEEEQQEQEEEEKDAANVEDKLITNVPVALPPSTIADQHTLAELSSTIDHMLRDHLHILHEVTDNEEPSTTTINPEKEKNKKNNKKNKSRRHEMKITDNKIDDKHSTIAPFMPQGKFSAFSHNPAQSASAHSSRSPSSITPFANQQLQSHKLELAKQQNRNVNKRLQSPISCSSAKSSTRSSLNKINNKEPNKSVTSSITIDSTTTNNVNSSSNISMTISTSASTSSSSDNDKKEKGHKEIDELLLLSRMQRTFATMDSETQDIIERTSQNKKSNNADSNVINNLAKATNQAPLLSSVVPKSDTVQWVYKRGQMPEVAIRRLNAYRVENLERIAREERIWNTSNISQFTFASRLTDALFEDCFDEVMSEVNSIMDNYVDGLAEHEMA